MLLGFRTGLDVMDARGRGDPQRLQGLGGLRADLGGLQDAGPAALVLDDLDGVQAGQHVAPGIAGSPFGDALEQQRQDAEGEVSADSVRGPVEDRPGKG